MSSNINENTLTELVCTRLSHDVIGNIGAVANAVELLEEGDMDFLEDIKSILKTSSKVLSSRLKFFRMAFGLNNGNLENLNNIKSCIEDYLKTIGNQNYPLELVFQVETPHFGKVAMLSVMILADTMIRGGKIEIIELNGKLSAVSHPAANSPVEKIELIKSVLRGDCLELNAQYAPAFYLLSLLKQENLNLSVLDFSEFGFRFE